MASRPERVGVLVIRVWLEAGQDADRSFRARITVTSDLSTRSDESRVVATMPEVLEAVRDFLEEFTGFD